MQLFVAILYSIDSVDIFTDAGLAPSSSNYPVDRRGEHLVRISADWNCVETLGVFFFAELFTAGKLHWQYGKFKFHLFHP